MEKTIGEHGKRFFNFLIENNNKKRVRLIGLGMIIRTLNKLYEQKIHLIPITKDLEIEIKPEYFDKPESYQKKIEQPYPKELFLVRDNKLYFTKFATQRIIKELDIYDDNKRYTSNPDLFREMSESDMKISNLNTPKDFTKEEQEQIKQYNNITHLHDKEYIIPNDYLKTKNLYTLFNRDIRGTKFLLNPFIPIEYEFSPSDMKEKVKKMRFKIIDRVQRKKDIFGIIWTSQYKIECPRCNEEMTLLPHEMNQNIQHLCPGNHVPIYKTITKKGAVENDISKDLFLYECQILDQNNKPKKDQSSIFIYSEEPNLKKAIYIGDIFMTRTYLDLTVASPNLTNLLFLLGFKKDTTTTNKEYLIMKNPKAIEMAKRLNVPHTRILDVLQSVRDIIKETTKYIEITDQGTLLQIFIIISGLGRELFNYQKIGINVMGDKSLGKTFVGGMIGMMLDEDYVTLENSENMTAAGFIGGINNKKVINGKSESVFEPGIVTKYGLTVLDEGERMFSERSLNLALKNFPNRSLNIEKVGGESDVPQNYTPIICSNFYDSYHNMEYVKTIKEVYFTFARKDMTNTFHPNNRIEMNKYIDKCNVYLTLNDTQETYQNENLTKAIYYTRLKMESANRDWRTGGRIEPSYRLLFDVVCQTKINKMVKNKERRVKKSIPTTLPETHLFPVKQFLEELKKKLINYRSINLYDFEYNDDETIEQITKLKDDIANWILDGTNNIHMHLAGNAYEIDPKIYAVLENVMVILQMTEDHNSIKLSENIKIFAEAIIMKCKRGLKKEEYDFTDHSFKGDFARYDFDELDLNIQKSREELDSETLQKAIKKEKEKQFTNDNKVDWQEVAKG